MDNANTNKCVNCGDQLNNNSPLLNCSQCKGELCNKCANGHYKERPNHKLSLVKIISPEELNGEIYMNNCENCGKDLNKLNNYNNCDKCNIPLCDECADNHDKQFPSHKMKIKSKNIIKPEQTPEEDISNQLNKNRDSLQIPQIKCDICEKNIPYKNNGNMSYCNDCKGNLCPDCNNSHNNDFPSHEKNKVKMLIVNSPDEENISSLPLLKCKNCNKELNDKIDDPIHHCSTCNGDLCQKCGNEHYGTKLNHKLSLVKYILPIPFNNDLNCGKCGKDLKNINNYSVCENCNSPLCNECEDNHKQRYPKHRLRIKRNQPQSKKEYEPNNYPNEEMLQIPNVNCMECDNNIPIRNNKNICYCYECDGNLCNECNNNHNNKYPYHNKNNNIQIIEINNNEENKDLSLFKCNQCNKILNEKQPIQNCNQCQLNLCDKCINNHNKLKPDHKISLNQYISSPLNKNKCNECGKELNKENYEECDECNIPLCNECLDNHNENSEHKLGKIKLRNIIIFKLIPPSI